MRASYVGKELAAFFILSAFVVKKIIGARWWYESRHKPVVERDMDQIVKSQDKRILERRALSGLNRPRRLASHTRRHGGLERTNEPPANQPRDFDT